LLPSMGSETRSELFPVGRELVIQGGVHAI
jgi:hypothetical protein